MADNSEAGADKVYGAPTKVDAQQVFAKHTLAFDGDPDTLRKIARGEISTEDLKGNEGDLASALVIEYPKDQSGNGTTATSTRFVALQVLLMPWHTLPCCPVSNVLGAHLPAACIIRLALLLSWPT